MECKDPKSHISQILPTSPNSNNTSSTSSPLTRRRIQEAIETDTDHNDNNNNIDSPTVFSSSPRRKLQQALQRDVDVGEVKEVSSSFVSAILKNILSEHSMK